MGWWTTEDGKLIGDGPLDVAQELLTRLAAEYKDDHGRLPTLDELLECLKLALAAEVDSLVSDRPSVLITALSVKTRKRAPARKPGDVFAIPLGANDYAIGMLTPQWGIGDFFPVRQKKPRWNPRLRGGPSFRLRSRLPDDPFDSGEWPVIAHEDYPSDGFKLTPFRAGNRIFCGTGTSKGFVDISSESRVATPEELETIPSASILSESMVIEMLKEKLRDIEPG